MQGACGFLRKDDSLPEMMQTLRSSRPGGMVVNPGLLTSHDLAGIGAKQCLFPPLTRREREVLTLSWRLS